MVLPYLPDGSEPVRGCDRHGEWLADGIYGKIPSASRSHGGVLLVFFPILHMCPPARAAITSHKICEPYPKAGPTVKAKRPERLIERTISGGNQAGGPLTHNSRGEFPASLCIREYRPICVICGSPILFLVEIHSAVDPRDLAVYEGRRG